MGDLAPDGEVAVDLDPEEQRVLGALVEKSFVTPDAYPLTMNGLLAACNQSSNRNPVVAYDESTVQRAIDGLREKGLLRIVHSRSNRATKYRHVADEAWALSREEVAVLAVLLLRGPQTSGELRGRTDRLATFGSLEEVEQVLAALAGRARPLVTRLERQPGQKEARWGHLLGSAAGVGDEQRADAGGRTGDDAEPGATGLPGERAGVRRELATELPDELATLPDERATLPDELAAVRHELAAVRRNLEDLREDLAAVRRDLDELRAELS